MRFSTPSPDGRAGVYRPIILSNPVTVSATITQGNGYGGLLNHYDAGFLVGNRGDLSSGYGVAVYRSDQNYANSSVSLVLGGTQLASVPSSFQFGAAIAVTITFNPDGITGSVSGNGNTFNFSFDPHSATLPGSNFTIVQGFSDGRSTVITNQTLDNLNIAYSCGFPE